MRLRMIGLVLCAFALASSGPVPEILPHTVVDQPQHGVISLQFEASSKTPVCMREDWILNGGPDGGPIVLQVAGKRYPLKADAIRRCERDCVARLVEGYTQKSHIPYEAFGLPEDLADAPKTVEATLVAASCEGTAPLREESFKSSDWMPVGSTEKQICAVFGAATRWNNRDQIRLARSSGESLRGPYEYDPEQLPGGAIFDFYLSLPAAQMTDPKEFSRDFRYYILAERGRTAGMSKIEQMRHLLISALPPASEIRDFGGADESVRFNESRMVGAYMPAMCRLQALCKPHGTVRPARNLPCGDLRELTPQTP